MISDMLTHALEVNWQCCYWLVQGHLTDVSSCLWGFCLEYSLFMVSHPPVTLTRFGGLFIYFFTWSESILFSLSFICGYMDHTFYIFVFPGMLEGKHVCIDYCDKTNSVHQYPFLPSFLGSQLTIFPSNCPFPTTYPILPSWPNEMLTLPINSQHCLSHAHTLYVSVCLEVKVSKM